MGAIHDAGLPLKRVEGAYRYRYIGIHDHRFRGQSLGCGRGAGRCLQQRPAPLVVPGLRFERRSPRCKGGILPLDEPGQISLGSARSGAKNGAGRAFSWRHCPNIPYVLYRSQTIYPEKRTCL
jgi:hypothetical protein